MLVGGYGVPSAKISIVPNGVADHFFRATEDAFIRAHDIKHPIVLCVAAIEPRKNQLSLVRALAALPIQIVLIGMCSAENRPYLEKILAVGDTKVRYLQPMAYSEPLLASAYAAADLFVLPSVSEVQPLSVLEALAAGCPVVMTNNHCLDIAPRAKALVEVNPANERDIQRAVSSLLDCRPDRAKIKSMVSGLSWSSVASTLIGVYNQVIKGKSSS
jgi:hypothetical protein